MIDPVTSLALSVPSSSTTAVGQGLDIAGASSGSAAATEAAGGRFTDLLADFSTQTMDRLNGAETMSIGALRGEVGPREVAEAVMSAEQSLQVAIAVRDKIVTAYLEISRMAI